MRARRIVEPRTLREVEVLVEMGRETLATQETSQVWVATGSEPGQGYAETVHDEAGMELQAACRRLEDLADAITVTLQAIEAERIIVQSMRDR
jgi:hypothetical protein